MFDSFRKFHCLGIRFFPVVGWAERGGDLAEGHANSVPRFHIVWGTGPGLVKPFETKVHQAMEKGLVDYRPRHRVNELITDKGTVIGVRGSILVPSSVTRGEESSRDVIGDFEFYSKSVIVSSGSIGANYDLIKKNWPARLGNPPNKMIEKEFALSGSEQNPDLTGKSIKKVLSRILPGAPAPVKAFMDHGEDFIISASQTFSNVLITDESGTGKALIGIN